MQKLFQCLTIMFFLAVLLNESAFSANELYRSIASGNWNSNGTWEMSTNGGGSWFAATSTPRDTSGIITIRNPNTVTITVSTTANQLVLDSGGVIAVNSGIVLTIPDAAGNDITMFKGSILNGPGTVRTQGADNAINLRAGSAFNAVLNVNTGITYAFDQSPPYDGSLFGNVIIDAGALLNGGNATGRHLSILGNITNNGTITASSAGGSYSIHGPSLVNNGLMTCGGTVYMDTTTTISGSGSFTPNITLISGNVTMLSNITYSPVSYIATVAGGVLNPNGNIFTLNSGGLGLDPGTTVSSPGTVRTQNTVSINLRAGSAFNAVLNVNTGITYAYDQTAPYDGSVFGNVIIDAGATLNGGNASGRKLFIYGSVINNGTLTATSTGGTVRIKGPSLINNGSVSVAGSLYFDTTTSVSGSGSFTSAYQYISPNGKITLLSNITMSPTAELTMLAGAAVLNLNGFVMTYNSGTFILNAGNTVNGPGTVKTQNDVAIYTGNSSAFNANIWVNTHSLSSGTTGVDRFFGNVTVDAGATYHCGWTSGRITAFYGNVINNGTMTTNSTNGHIRMRGPSLVNNGAINAAGSFHFDTVTTVSGTGSFTTANQYIYPNGKITLMSNITMTPSATLTMLTGAALLNLNGFVMTYNSGEFILNAGNTVNGPGTVMSQGNVAIYTGNSSAFNANIKVDEGFLTSGTIAVDRIFGNVIIDSGASYNCGWSSGRRTDFYGSITNNGTLYTSSTGGVIRIKGPSLTNNGVVSPAGSFFFDTTTALSGTGSFTSHANFAGNANVTLNSTHQMSSLTINLGTVFNISNQILKLTASNPITQSGTFTNANSTVEYNGTVGQTISVTNITYHRLKINNAAGTGLPNNVTVNDTLSVLLGDLNLSGRILTISPIGYLTETPGNTVLGTSGYITTTRNINAPSSLNVGGLGAVLSTLSNLGTTEIRRGHTVQTGLNGGTSIARYFDITPVNNSDLDATLVFKYDDSELNGKPESALKLFSSTNTGLTWSLKGGAPNTVTNSILISKLSSFSRWSADTSGVSMVLNVAIEGFYNTVTNRLNMRDTVRAYFRNTTSPFAIVDSAKAVIDSLTFQGSFNFPNAPSGTYYIMIKHRNSIETWSRAGGEVYTVGNTLHYNFPLDSNKAYGNNQKFVGTKWTIFSGDVNQNGIINLTDILLVSNAASSFSSGYVVTDVNGDRVTNLTDIIFTSNNSNLFVTKKTP